MGTVKTLEDMTSQELEVKKVKALDKIARNLETIAIWLDDIDSEEWSDRIQWYLDMFKKAYLDEKIKKGE